MRTHTQPRRRFSSRNGPVVHPVTELGSSPPPPLPRLHLGTFPTIQPGDAHDAGQGQFMDHPTPQTRRYDALAGGRHASPDFEPNRGRGVRSSRLNNAICSRTLHYDRQSNCRPGRCGGTGDTTRRGAGIDRGGAGAGDGARRPHLGAGTHPGGSPRSGLPVRRTRHSGRATNPHRRTRRRRHFDRSGSR